MALLFYGNKTDMVGVVFFRNQVSLIYGGRSKEKGHAYSPHDLFLSLEF